MSTIFCFSNSDGLSGIFLILVSVFISSVPIIIGIVIVFKCHIHIISISMLSYFKSLSKSFVGFFLADKMTMSTRQHLRFLKSFFIITGLLACVEQLKCMVKLLLLLCLLLLLLSNSSSSR